MIIIPIPAGIACAQPLGNKVLDKLIIKKHNKDKKQNENDQQTINFFDKIYRKCLQDNVIDKNEYEPLSSKFTKNVTETKINLFYK